MELQELDARMRELTPHQLKIVEALYHANGEWLTRIQVARALGKKRLTPYDIDCLKQLSDMGIANMSTQPTTAPGSDFAYIYNMGDDVAQLLQQWAQQKEANEQARKRKPLNLAPDSH
jgi:hypothetical protein